MDVAAFSLQLMDHLVTLHQDLADKTYRHGFYYPFRINDPKPRHIHKASVRDRLVHHSIYRILYPLFDRFFIHDSYSCRKDKGAHRAINRFRQFSRIVSRNNTKTAWVLKCDIRKFFATIDHAVLMTILQKRIKDNSTLCLLLELIESFQTERMMGVGLPLGNLTSQLFVNVYMNEFDQFVKRRLKVRHYIRYADDFVFMHSDREYLEGILPQIDDFLQINLKLSLHPGKVSIKTLASGVDFLGWVHFPDHRVLRTATKKRMLRLLRQSSSDERRASYTGLLSHGNMYKLNRRLFGMIE